MDSLLSTSSPGYLVPNSRKSVLGNVLCGYHKPIVRFSNGFTNSSQKLSCRFRRKSVIVGAKNNSRKKEDTHRSVPKPDEATGLFPEALLLKEKKVEKDGKLLPEFADAEEEELYEYLNLQLESDLNVERMRHYEVVYLIHEKHAEEVGSVNEGVQDFLREKKGKIWRLSDWGMRRLAYKIKKAKKAHYMLMNFELQAKWINDFKNMLDKDERIIRHLVMKRDEAITEDCPPPPEFHTLRSGMEDHDEDEYDDGDDLGEDWDDEDGFDGYGDEDAIVLVNVDEDEDDDTQRAANKSGTSGNKGARNQRAEKVGR